MYVRVNRSGRGGGARVLQVMLCFMLWLRVDRRRRVLHLFCELHARAWDGLRTFQVDAAPL